MVDFAGGEEDAHDRANQERWRRIFRQIVRLDSRPALGSLSERRRFQETEVSVTKYPLCWPAGWKRTVNRERARFKKQTHAIQNGQRMWTGSRGLSVSEANERVVKELRAMWVPDY